MVDNRHSPLPRRPGWSAKAVGWGILPLVAAMGLGCEPRVCVHSHEEQYVDAPIGWNVGGGIVIPLGEGKVKTRRVCDRWEPAGGHR